MESKLKIANPLKLLLEWICNPFSIVYEFLGLCISFQILESNIISVCIMWFFNDNYCSMDQYAYSKEH